MDVRTIAMILLVINIITGIFLWMVMCKQIRLIRLNINDLQPLRITFLAITIVAFLGQFAPVAIVLNAILLDATASGRSPSTLGVVYGFSNSLTALATSIILYSIYYRSSHDKDSGTG